MRKVFSMAAAIMLCMFSANAQYIMKIKMKSGQETEYNVPDIENITWEEKKVEPHEYVDLGLSVKWATCNVGASSPEEYGNYYAWGETEEKSIYDLSTYKWCYGSFYSMTKYCTKSKYGYIDDKKILDPEDDVAHVEWGGDWRMATYEEWHELSYYCYSLWTTRNGVYGVKLTSKLNGNSIFLPAAGRKENSLEKDGDYGNYWTATLYAGNESAACLSYVNKSGGPYASDIARYCGLSIRPVCP